MTDIASLGVEVDTSQAGTGSRDLDRLASSATNAQREVDRLRTATENSTRAQGEANTIAKRAAAALGERTTSSQSLLRAEVALARALQARAQSEFRNLSAITGTTEAQLKAASAVATLARQRTDSARVALLEFTAMEKASAAQESASAAAAELSSRYDLLSSKFTEGYQEARLMDAALEDLAEAERLGIQITGGASNAIDQIILKYDARARAAAELRAELDRLRTAEAMSASAADGQSRFGVAAGSGKSAQESAKLFSMMMDEETSATSASAQQYYNRILGVQDKVENSARESANAFEAEARKMEELNRAAARLRGNIDPLGAAQDRYNREIREYNMLARQGVISAKELGQAHSMAASRLNNYNAVMNGGMESTGAGRQANLSNVVAQFQDIGVTAQMGMNPLTIALQQGTQLSQALLMMENPLKGIGQGLLALISPLSILTLSMVALVAVGLQMVDWPTVGAVALNAFASALEATAPYVVGLAAVLALIYSPAIIGGIVSLVAMISRLGVTALIAGGRMMTGWLMAMGPLGAIILGVALIVTALVAFRDQVTQIFGRDIVKDIQNSANYLIGTFVGAYDGVIAAWDMFPAAISDLVLVGVNGIISTVESMLNSVIGSLNNFMNDARQAAYNAGFPLREGVGSPLSPVVFDRVDNPNAGAAGKVGEELDAAIKKAQGFDYVGAAIDGVNRAAGGAADAIRGLADSFGASDKDSKKAAAAAEKAAEAYKKIIDGGKEFITNQMLEAQALGMTEQAANKMRYEQDMLNQAANDNIKLSPAQRSELSLLAQAMSEVEARTKSLTEWYNIGRSAFGSFMTDFKNDLMNGASLWDSFANAASKALDSIADKALTMAANGIFDMIFGAVMGGLGGGGGGGLFGGGMSGGLGGISSITGSGGGFFPGFSTGGYTGDTPADRAAGIVHGKEYVLNAAATRKIGRPALDALNMGGAPAASAPSNDNLTTVNVFNQSGSTVKTRTKRDSDGKRELQVFVLETVADGRRRGVSV